MDRSKADEENVGNEKTSTSPDSSKRPGFDHFRADELNPIKTSAMSEYFDLSRMIDTFVSLRSYLVILVPL